MNKPYSSKTLLTKDPGSLYLSTGQFAVTDIAGAQTLKIQLGAVTSLIKLAGTNLFYLEGSYSDYQIKATGKKVSLLDANGGQIQMTLGMESQTLIFADGLLSLGYKDNMVTLSNDSGAAQVVGKTLAAIEAKPDISQTAAGKFNHNITLFDASQSVVNDAEGDDQYALGLGARLTLNAIKGENVLFLEGAASDYTIKAVGKKVSLQDSQNGILLLTQGKSPQTLVWADGSALLQLSSDSKKVELGDQTLNATLNPISATLDAASNSVQYFSVSNDDNLAENLADSVADYFATKGINPYNAPELSDGLNMPIQGVRFKRNQNDTATQPDAVKNITIEEDDPKQLWGSIWQPSSANGENSLSYSFAPINPSLPTYYEEKYKDSAIALAIPLITLSEQTLRIWSNYIDLKFARVTEPQQVGDLRFIGSKNEVLIESAMAFPPAKSLGGASGDVWIGPNIPSTSTKPGTYSYLTLLHEIGHALGLIHPQSNIHNELRYTIMSYREYAGDSDEDHKGSFFPTTPMLDDIQAMQSFYNANSDYAKENNTYQWAPAQSVFETIWDSGGIDTLDGSNQGDSVTFNLNSGEWSTVGVAFSDSSRHLVRNRLTIAYDVEIENATGSQYNDILFGNQLPNQLRGLQGNDTLTGSGGKDTFVFEDRENGIDTITDFTRDDALDFSAFLKDSISILETPVNNNQQSLNMTQEFNVGVIYNKTGALKQTDIVLQPQIGKVALPAYGKAVVITTADPDGVKDIAKLPYQIYYVEGYVLDNGTQRYYVDKVADLKSAQGLNASDLTNPAVYTNVSNSNSLSYQLSIAGNATTVNEGSVVTFQLRTQNVANGTVLPYKLTGVQPSDIVGGQTSGNLTITNDAAELVLELTNDILSEGSEILTLNVNDKTYISVSINDTSIPNVVTTYALSTANNATSVNEGGSVTFNLATQNVANGTVLPYNLSGIQAADIVGGSLGGNLTVTNNAATFTVQLASDQTSEGNEMLTVKIGDNLANQSLLINDTSIPAVVPTYALSVANNATSVNEGGSVTFNLKTTNVANGTVLPYSLSGTGIQAADIVGGQLSGNLTVNNNAASLTLQLISDQSTEGNEMLTVKIGDNLANQSLLVNDTSRLTLINSAGSASDAGLAVKTTYQITPGDYLYTLQNFDIGDSLVFKTSGNTPTLDNESYEDGTVSILYAVNGGLTQIDLIGLSTAVDQQLNGIGDFTTLYGTGSLVWG